MTILVPGTNTHLSTEYKASIKDLPNPLEAMNIGNDLCQNSCKIAICIG